MKIELLSNEHIVRGISENDIDELFKLCSGNPLYYAYCPPFVSRDSLRQELQALPPGKQLTDKYFVGFYLNNKLIAVIDLIDGYPRPSIAFIGFFMLRESIQGKGQGSKIIQGVCDYLKELGYDTVRLAWVKGNPQAERFWIKNHFVMIKETSSSAAASVILAERLLKQ